MIRTRQFLLSTAVAAGMPAYLLAPLTVHAQGTTQPAAVAIDSDDIGGLVTGPNGPEAGVWVIAETRARYSKSVVTDDQGRFVIPDLPRGKYKVWIRGYGLIDSSRMDAEPGQRLNLVAVPAPNETAAAQYYPAIYWYSMLKIPPADQFGGKSDIPSNVRQIHWIAGMKNNGCIGCHQIGQLGTRTIRHL
jgi:Carboxypeptidase regulatory-like domain